MDNEKIHGAELNDSDLDQVFGGNEDKPSCQYYKQRDSYTKCPNPLKTLCQQCNKCKLNK